MDSQLQMVCIPISEIAGEHEIVTKLREELGVCFSEPPSGQLTDEGLRRLANHQLIHVVEKGGRYWCIAGFRIFRILKAGLPGASEIPVVLQRRIRSVELRDSVLLELLVIPAILSIHPLERKLMGELWQSQRDSEFFVSALRNSGTGALAQILGCDPRTVEGRG